MPDSATVTEDQDSTQQRIKLIVPSPSTKMILGKALAGDTTATNATPPPASYPGVSGITTESILFQGTGTSSYGTIETTKSILVHSCTGSLVGYAGTDALLGASGNAYVTAPSSVFIGSSPTAGSISSMSGYALPTDDDPASSTTAAQIADAETTTKKVNEVLTIISTTFAVLGFVAGKRVDWGSLGVGLVQISIMAASTLASPKGSGEVTVWGGNSVTVASSYGVHVLADTAVTIMSPQFVSTFAGVQASMTGGLSAGLTGGVTASLTSFGMATLLGYFKATVASRRGSVDVVGTDIAIGDRNTPYLQGDTTNVRIAAQNTISATVGPGKAASPANATITSTGLVLKGEAHDVTASQRFSVGVGVSTLAVDPSSVVLAGSPVPDALKTALDAADAEYETAWTAASLAFYAMTKASPLSPSSAADKAARKLANTIYEGSIEVAKNARNAAIKAAKAMIGQVKCIVDAKSARLTNGLAEVSVNPLGMIMIDAKGQMITLQSGPNSIQISPAGVKIQGMMIDAG